MHKLALISDIHGNIPALESVLQDIHNREIKHIYCLGDLVGKGPHPAQAVDMIREHCSIIVQGNWDDFIPNETDQEMILWQQERLGSERLAFLKQLRFAYEFHLSGKRVRLFHASPISVHHRIQPWDDLGKRKAMFNNTTQVGQSGQEPDIIGYGDVHNAFIQNHQGKTLFNTGSVGNPLDIPEASYTIMEGSLGSMESDVYSIQFVRVPYDIEQAISMAKEAELLDLDIYAKELRTARYRGLDE